MRIEVKDIQVEHPELGILNKKIIIFYTDEDVEITRENLSEVHFLWDIDINRLSKLEKALLDQQLKQYLGI